MTENAASAPAAVVPADVTPASAAEKAAWVLAAAALLFVFHARLVPALLAGLLVHAVLHRTAGLLRGPRLSHGAAKFLSLGVVGAASVAVTVLAAWALVAFVRGHIGNLPGLFEKMADVLDRSRAQLATWGLPQEALETFRTGEQIKDALSGWLRTHAAELTKAGGEAGRMALHGVMGILAALLVFFRHASPAPRPLAAALSGRVRRFADSFERMVIAQVEISAVNTVLTAIYLFAVLPLLGQKLPLRGTLVLLTFVAGLLPVVGNLISNTVVVVVSFGTAPWVALVSLGFLVAVHKLEYLVNAKIVGDRIGAQAWEIFLSIVALEVAFGVPGVVVAPIAYAWVKGELRERNLV